MAENNVIIREQLKIIDNSYLSIPTKIKKFKLHNVEVVRKTKVWKNLWGYIPTNCFAYALGFEHSNVYQEINYNTNISPHLNL